MKKKNKAVKAVNTALGLIMLIMVILCSPLFGYARGFAPEDQRATESVFTETNRTSPSGLVPVGSTPRPTPPPTPTPVILPTAPPTPVPTPVPERTPQPQPVVQQPVYNNWQPEQYEPEMEEYVEPEPEVQPVIENQQQGSMSVSIAENGNGVIQDSDADLVINLPGVGQSSAISVAMPGAEETTAGTEVSTEVSTPVSTEVGTGGEEFVLQSPVQDSNEAEPPAFG